MDYGDEEDAKNEFYTSEIDWGEETDQSWSGEEDCDNNSWREETDSEISLEGVDECDEEPCYEETNSEGAFEEEEHQVDDEIKIEPPENFQDTTSDYEEENPESDSWSVGTESRFSQVEEENRPWCEIPYSDHEEEHQEETESQTYLEESEAIFGEDFAEESEVEGEAGRDDFEGDITEEEEVISEAGRDDYEHRYINFSGHHQGPEAYLRWERDMEEWFQANHIQEEEKTVVAEETLTDEAFLHWDKDAYERLDYELPDHTWDEMKQLLHQEFVEKTTTEPYYPRPTVPSELRRWITATPTKKVSDPKARRQTSTNPKEKLKKKPVEFIKKKPQVPKVKEKLPKERVDQKQNLQEEINVSSTIQQQPAAPQQGKCTNSNKFKDLICYRCHKRGHYAVTCPSKKVTLLEEKTELSKTSDSLVHSDLLNSNSSIMHLSLPRGLYTGPEKKVKEEKVQILIQLAEAHNVRTSITRFILTLSRSDVMHLFLPFGLCSGTNSEIECKAPEFVKRRKEPSLCKKPERQKLEVVPATFITLKPEADQSTSRKERFKEKRPDPAKNTESVGQVSHSFTQFVSHDATAMLKSLLNIKEHEENDYLKSQVDINFGKTSVKELDSTVLYHPRESIMHLFLGQSVDLISGTRGVKHKKENLALNQSQNQRRRAPMMINTTPPKGIDAEQGRNRGAVLSHLLKGEPPDVPIITKPHAYQGKTLDSQRRMKTNLLCIGADYIVSRSKLFQERGYDADIQTIQYRDDGWIKPAAEPKLSQTGCTTPTRPDKDICSMFEAYRLNHEDSRHKNTWRSFITQLQNTTKKNHPKIYYHEEVMEVTSQQFYNASDKDRRSLNKVYRPDQREFGNEFNCFGLSVHNRRPENWNQTEIHSGLKVIQLTNRRILHLPYLVARGFSCLQTRLWRPGDTSNHSGDTYNHPEDSSIILQCTTPHLIKWIKGELHFPYLDPRAFKALQQLYSIEATNWRPSRSTRGFPFNPGRRPHSSPRAEDPKQQVESLLALFGCVHTQQLYSFELCELETIFTHQRLPRTHHYLPKLTRYKGPPRHATNCPILSFKA